MTALARTLQVLHARWILHIRSQNRPLNPPSGEDLVREQLPAAGPAGAPADAAQQQMPAAVRERLVRAAQSELDRLVRSRSAAVAGSDSSGPPPLPPLLQACSAYASCAAAVLAASAADGAAAGGHSWSHASLASGDDARTDFRTGASLAPHPNDRCQLVARLHSELLVFEQRCLCAGALGEALQQISKLWGDALLGQALLPCAEPLAELAGALGACTQQRAASDFSR